MKCPGCGYERDGSEQVPEWQCPSCEIAYNKHPNYQGPSIEKPPTKKQDKWNLSAGMKILVGVLVLTGVVLTYSSYEGRRQFKVVLIRIMYCS